MLRAYKYRLYPNKSQAEMLNKQFGACRFIFNLALETKSYAWQTQNKNITAYDLHKQLTDLRKDHKWLQESSRDALEKSILNLEKGYKSFFNGAGFPKFKSKRGKQSFSTRECISVDWENSVINIPKIKNIPIVLSRKFEGKIRQVTVTKTPTGKYFISILAQDGKELPQKSQIKNAVGIDLGLKHFAITSDGEKFENPKYLRESLGRLNVLQRRSSKKIKGSANRRKANLKVAILHERITNQRKDFLHKLSSKLISDNQAICIEDLNVRGMVKNRNLALSISDAGWSEFVSMLKYKSDWYGKTLLQLPRFQPSTKVCSSCGIINDNLTLADRGWTCTCGAKHDRDVNAATNIKNYCLKNSPMDSRGAPVEMSVVQESMKQEVYIKTCQQ